MTAITIIFLFTIYYLFSIGFLLGILTSVKSTLGRILYFLTSLLAFLTFPFLLGKLLSNRI